MNKALLLIALTCGLGGCLKPLPTDIPDYAQMYPGSAFQMAMNVGPMTNVIYKATAQPDAVLAYYQTHASTDGLQQQAEPTAARAGGQQRELFYDAATGRRLLVLVEAQPQGSLVSVSYPTPTKRTI